MNSKIPCLLVVMLGGLTLSGCVTGRRHISVSVPYTATSPDAKGPVYIHSVTDNRKFENAPSDPSTPSINGDVNTMSPTERDRMIGRQRNTYGHGMGDIDLSNHGTVSSLTRQLVENSLRRNGYAISNDPNAPITVDASIDKFWTWMTPGFFALTFEVNIATNLTFNKAGDSIIETINGYGRSHGQFAKDVNWQQTFAPAFKSYFDNFAVKLGNAETYFNHSKSSPKLTDELYSKLKHLEELRKDGTLTEEEFQSQKKKVLEKE